MSLAAAVAAGFACRADAPQPRAAPAAEQAPAPSRPAGRARVVVTAAGGRELSVVAEIARSDAERERGLMFRERLAADEGMLFVFPERAEHAFWMRNTIIPLDMLFADGGRIVGIVEHAQPGSLELRSGGPCREVLEVNAGWVAANQVRVGDRFAWHELPR